MLARSRRFLAILACGSLVASAWGSELSALRQQLHLRLRTQQQELAPLSKLNLRLYDHQRHHAGFLKGQHDADGVHFQHLDLRFVQAGSELLLPRLSGLSEDAVDSVHLIDVDADQLQHSASGLAGSLSWRWQYGRPIRDLMTGVVLHHTPPELRPLMGWSLGDQARTRVQTTTVEIEMLRPAAGYLLRGQLLGGISGRRTLHLDAWLDGDRSRRAWALAPSWSKASHRLDLSRLQLSEARLQGEIVVLLGADRWVGPPDPLAQQIFEVDLPIVDGLVSGPVAASGELGDYPAQLELTVLPVAAGRWRRQPATGEADEGACLVGRTPMQNPTAPLDPEDQVGEAAELAALATAATLPGLPLSYARRLVRIMTPADAEPSEAFAGAVGNFYQAHLAAERVSAVFGETSSAAPDFAPIWGQTEALPSRDGVVELAGAAAAGPQRWGHVSEWRYLGPLPLAQDASFGAPLMPEVYEGSGPLQVPGGDTVDWRSAQANGAVLPPPLQAKVMAAQVPTFAWYAASRLHLAQAGVLWVAVRANPHSRLWVDGRLRWRGDALSHPRRYAVLPLQLQSGMHDIVLRSGLDELSYSVGLGSNTANAAAKLPDAAIGLWICQQGEPQLSELASATPAVAKPSPRPPLAWDLASGRGVLWQQSLPVVEQSPVVAGQQLYVGLEAGGLLCLDADSGEQRWRSASSSPAIAILADDQAVIYRSGDSLQRLSSDGTELWRVSLTLAGLPVPKLKRSGDLLLIADAEAGSKGKGKDADEEEARLTITALAEADGSRRWQRQLPTRQTALHLMQAHGGGEVLVCGDGSLIDPTSGELLQQQIFGPIDDPALGAEVHGLCDDGQGRVVIFSGGKDYQSGAWQAGWKAASRVIRRDTRIGARFLWRRSGPSHASSAPPLIHDGRLYLLSVANEHHMEYPSPRVGLHVYDLESGVQLHDIKPLFDGCLSPVSLDLAGGWIMATNAGKGGVFVNKDDRPLLALVQPGERAAAFAVLPWLRSTAAPLAVDGRVYGVGEGKVLCLGGNDAETQAWQWRELQNNVLQLIGGGPAELDQALALVAATTLSPTLPRNEFRDGAMPADWLQSTAPATAADSLAAQIERGDWQPALGEQVLPLQAPWQALPPAARPSGGTAYVRSGNTWTYDRQWRLDLAQLLQGRDLVVLSAVIDNPLPRRVWIEYEGCPGRFWIGSQEIAAEKPLLLPAGEHLVTLVLQPGRLPPVALSRIRVVWKLRQLADWKDERRRFRNRLHSLQPILQLLQQHLPPDKLSAYVQSWLTLLEDPK